MSVQQTFGRLHLFDILADLIPGATLLTGLTLLFEVPDSPQFLSNIGVFLVLSYVLGHAVQWSLTAVGDPPAHFPELMKYLNGDNEEVPEIAYTEVEESFLELCQDEFNLSKEFDDYDRLFDLLTSYLDGMPASKGLRLQAIFSFSWAMARVSAIVSLVGLVGLAVSLSWPSIIRSPPIAIGSVIVGGLGYYVFKQRKESFGEDFVEYVIADFYNYKVTKDDDQS